VNVIWFEKINTFVFLAYGSEENEKGVILSARIAGFVFG
jgi:hypothetical protein